MSVLYKTPYFKYALIQLASTFFNNIHVLLLPYWYYEVTNSKVASGVIFVVEAAISLVCLPFAGVLIDRFSHKKLTVITEAMRGASVAGLLWVDEQTPQFAVLLLAGIASAGASVFFALQQAVIKNNVSDDDAAAAQALLSMVQGLTLIVGPAFGAWLAGIFGYKFLFALNSASFVLSAVSIVFINDSTPRGERFSFFDNMRDAGRYVSTNPTLQQLYFIQLVTFFAVGSLGILFIYFFRSHSFNLSEISFMMGSHGVGVLAGSLVVQRFKFSCYGMAAPLAVSMGIVLILLASIPSLTPLLAGCILVIFGFLFVNVGIVIRTELQHTAEPEMMGRLASLLRLVTILGALSSTCLVVFSSPYSGPRVQLMMLGCVLSTSCLVVALRKINVPRAI